MTVFEFGDVVLVPFPFTNQHTTKQRPAVVISSRRYNVERPDVILLAVTSRCDSLAFGERAVRCWAEAGLLMPSFFKPLVATVEAPIIRKQLGRLYLEDLAAVRQLLAEVVG